MSLNIPLPEDSFLPLYLKRMGITDIPSRFHLWCALSLLAACGSNRVWHERFRGSKLYPNLYVFLLTNSGIGKNFAINEMSKFTIKPNSRIAAYNGEISYLSLIKKLASKNGEATPSRIFLMTPELSMSIGSGPMASAFIKHMTELFSPRDIPFEKSAESSGYYKLYECAVNWIAGSNPDWLIDAIDPKDIKGGFFARVIPVQELPDYTKRTYEPRYPANFDDITVELQRRVDILCRVKGQFEMSTRAKAIDRRWFERRDEPENDIVAASWFRAPEIVTKIAMVLALSEFELTQRLIILDRHVAYAQQLWGDIQTEMPALARLAATTPQTRAVEVLRLIVAGRRSMQHSQVLRRAMTRGLSNREIREGIQLLIESREWKHERLDRGIYYEFNGDDE